MIMIDEEPEDYLNSFDKSGDLSNEVRKLQSQSPKVSFQESPPSPKISIWKLTFWSLGNTTICLSHSSNPPFNTVIVFELNLFIESFHWGRMTVFNSVSFEKELLNSSNVYLFYDG